MLTNIVASIGIFTLPYSPQQTWTVEQKNTIFRLLVRATNCDVVRGGYVFEVGDNGRYLAVTKDDRYAPVVEVQALPGGKTSLVKGSKLALSTDHDLQRAALAAMRYLLSYGYIGQVFTIDAGRSDFGPGFDVFMSPVFYNELSGERLFPFDVDVLVSVDKHFKVRRSSLPGGH